MKWVSVLIHMRITYHSIVSYFFTQQISQLLQVLTIWIYCASVHVCMCVLLFVYCWISCVRAYIQYLGLHQTFIEAVS